MRLVTKPGRISWPDAKTSRTICTLRVHWPRTCNNFGRARPGPWPGQLALGFDGWRKNVIVAPTT